ncbi:hypothetical protein [Fusibacter sp. 3D3]|uniref:hypothetical protein n=1 Tax=Fusibacter sp. 3D3 TaxID=1048380 RepID=UPI001586456E|nr:hypothetical protein [Fusibacter sp. 3D3]
MSIVLIVVGLIIQFKVIDRVMIKSMLKSYKQQLCTVSVDSESYAIADFEDQIVYMDTYKNFFTEESFMEFYGNRIGSLYVDFVKANPKISLQFKEIKFDKFVYDSEKDRFIINYTLQIQASDGKVYTESNQSIIIKENGQRKIDHEKIFNYGSMFNN